MKEYKAFSLVELIVWITISMILMAWVWVFVSWWINNIVLQDKIIKNTSDFRDFSKDSLWIFSRMDTRLEPKVITSTSAIIKTNKYFDNLWVSYIWEISKDWFYCSWTDIDSTITKHILIKNFLPFEEIWEDIFTNYYSTLYSTSGWFKAFYKSHTIKDNSNNILVWKDWIFWTKLWEYWTWTLLNNPTWLAYDTTKKLLYIADTWNNRILVYNNDSSSSDYKKIYKLLWEKDWLNEPMWLALYDNRLFIANSWNWEILEYSSKSTSKELDLNFKINKTINNLRNFSIEVFSWVTDITKPDDVSQFTLVWITKKHPDYLTGSDNKITYWLTNFSNNFYSQSNQTCTNNYTKYYEDWGEIIKEEITNCNTSTWTIKKYKSSNYQNISSWTNIKISTNVNFDWTDFSKIQAYYLKLTLSWSSDYYENYFPFFINWDDDLLTRNDNTLKIISSDFKYPTWITYEWWKLKVNDFWDRKEYTLTLDWVKNSWTTIWAWNFNYSKIPEDKRNDYFLNTPIANLNINYDSLKKYLNLDLTYYKQYNCYNSDEKIKRSLILSKNFK